MRRATRIARHLYWRIAAMIVFVAIMAACVGTGMADRQPQGPQDGSPGGVEGTAGTPQGGEPDQDDEGVLTGDVRPLPEGEVLRWKPPDEYAGEEWIVVSSPMTSELVLIGEEGGIRRISSPTPAYGLASWRGLVIAAGHDPLGLVIADPEAGEIIATISYAGLEDSYDILVSGLVVIGDAAYLVTSDWNRARLVHFPLPSGDPVTVVDLDERGMYPAEACANQFGLFIEVVDGVLRVNPETRDVEERIRFDDPPGGIACSDDHIAITKHFEARALTLSAETSEVQQRFSWGASGYGRDVEFGQDGYLYAIDRGDPDVRGSIVRCRLADEVCDEPLAVGFNARELALRGDRAFVTVYGDTNVVEVDLKGWRIIGRHDVGTHATDPTVLRSD